MKRCSGHYGGTLNIDDKPGKGRNHEASKNEDKAILLFEKKPLLGLEETKKNFV